MKKSQKNRTEKKSGRHIKTNKYINNEKKKKKQKQIKPVINIKTNKTNKNERK